MQAFLFDSVDSTNEAAKRLIAEGKVRSTAYVLAREQTAGKGTRGRRWISPRDAGIYLSVIHTDGRDGYPTTTAYALSAGVASVEALSETFGLGVRIKPINDLWCEGRKLGGILTETYVQAKTTTALITGVGINVHRAERAVEGSVVSPVSLQELLSPERFDSFDFQPFAELLAGKIDQWHHRVIGGKAGQVVAEWRQHALPGFPLPSL